MSQIPPMNSGKMGTDAISGTESNASLATLTPEQQQSVHKNWNDVLNKLEGALRDFVKEVKTTKGEEFAKLKQPIQNLEKQVQVLHKEIDRALKMKLSPQQVKEYHAKWSADLKKMDREFVKHLPSDIKNRFEAKFKKIEDQIKQDEKEDKKEKPEIVIQDVGARGAALNKPETVVLHSEPLPAEIKTQVVSTIQLIQTMVDQIRVGRIGETTFTEIDLKQKAIDLPSFLQGTTLTLTQTENGKVTVTFNFPEHLPPIQKIQAHMAISHPDNQRELQTLVNNLGGKLNALQVGDLTVPLPAPQPAPMTAAPQGPGREGEEGRREGDRGGEGGGERERERREKRER